MHQSSHTGQFQLLITGRIIAGLGSTGMSSYPSRSTSPFNIQSHIAILPTFIIYLSSPLYTKLISTVIEGTQNKLFAHWFSGSYIAFIFALDIAWNRVTSIFSRAAAVPMSQINGFWGWALWIPTIACAANLGLCIAYWAFERNVPQAYRPKLGKEARKREGWDRRKFVLGYLTRLPKFFWILCGTRKYFFTLTLLSSC